MHVLILLFIRVIEELIWDTGFRLYCVVRHSYENTSCFLIFRTWFSVLQSEPSRLKYLEYHVSRALHYRHIHRRCEYSVKLTYLIFCLALERRAVTESTLPES